MSSLLLASVVNSQNLTIKGRVIDYEFSPVAGVDIYTEDQQFRTRTDQFGYYQLELPNTYHKVIFFTVGLEIQEVNLPDNNNSINCILDYANSDCFYTPSKSKDRKLKNKQQKRMEALYKEAKKRNVF